MDSYQWPLAALLALLLGGCHGGVETEVLERELRRQEDYIYQLQDQIEEYRMALDESRQGGGDQQPTPAGGAAAKDRAKSAAPTPSAPPDDLPDVDDLKPPPVELGTPVEPPSTDSAEPPSASPSETSQPAEDGPEMVPASADARQVERIVLRTSVPRQGGLHAVVQRHTATGHVAPVEGAVSLMVLAPAPAGRETRIARWDFTAEQIDARRLRTTTGRGLQLNLPWPGGPPAPGRYQLWGRLIAPDGKKLLTSLPVDIDRLGRVRIAANAPTASPTQRQRSTPVAAGKALAGSPPTAGGRHRPTASAVRSPQTPPIRSAEDTPRMASRPTQRGPQPPPATAGRPTWKPYR
jgi:hypothetical protein